MRRLHMLVGALVLVALGAAIALANGGDERDLAPSTTRVGSEPLVVRDPAGAADWVLRSYERGGRQCVRFGRQGKDPLLPPHDITCLPARRMSRPVVLSVMGAPMPPEPRTVVSGFVDPSVRRLTIAGPGAARTFEFAGGHAFLAVYEGYVTPTELPVTATLANGRKIRVDWGAGIRARAADPDHGAPWYVSAERRHSPPRERLVCAQFGRETARFGGSFERVPGRVICGRLDRDPYFFALSAWDDRLPSRRAGNEHVRVAKPTHWVLFGASTAEVTKVELQTPTGTRALPRSAENGGFIAVMSARGLERSDIRVTVTLAAGHKAEHIGPTDFKRASRAAPARVQPRPPAKRGTCELQGSRTLLRTPRGRVFSVDDGRQTLYHACPFDRPENLLLQRGGSFRLPVLTRPYVAWVGNGRINRVKFPGRVLRPVVVAGRVRALSVTRDGWVAWIRERPSGVFQVWRFDSRGPKLLDKGHVNPLSLCRMGSRVFWTHHDGKPRYDPCDLAGEQTAFIK